MVVIALLFYVHFQQMLWRMWEEILNDFFYWNDRHGFYRLIYYAMAWCLWIPVDLLWMSLVTTAKKDDTLAQINMLNGAEKMKFSCLLFTIVLHYIHSGNYGRRTESNYIWPRGNNNIWCRLSQDLKDYLSPCGLTCEIIIYPETI